MAAHELTGYRRKPDPPVTAACDLRKVRDSA